MESYKMYCAEKKLPEDPHTMLKFLDKADDIILCIDGATGKTLWKTVFARKGKFEQGHKIGPVNNTPCVGVGPAAGSAQGKVFAMGSSGKLYAVDAATGKALWETPSFVPQLKSEKDPFIRCYSGNAPICADGAVVMGDHGNTLYGFDAGTGKELWKLPGRNNNLAVPVRWVHQGKAYILTMDGECGNMGYVTNVTKVVCVEPKTGKQVERIYPSPVAGWNQGSLFFAEDKAIMVPDNVHGRNEFIMFDLTPGKYRHAMSWKPPHPTTTSYHAKPMQFPWVNGRVFIRGYDGIYCYDFRKTPAILKAEGILDDKGLDASRKVDQLIAMCGDADPDARKQGLMKLCRLVTEKQWGERGKDVLEVFDRFFTHPDGMVRAKIARALAVFGKEAVPQLVGQANKDEMGAWVQLLETIGNMGALEGAPELNALTAEALEHKEMSVVGVAIPTARQRGAAGADLLPLLLKIEASGNAPFDRNAMVSVLWILPDGKLPDPRPRGLEERLVDLMVEYKDMDTAYKAVNMIRALGYKDAYRIFTAVLKGDDALRGIRACAGMAAIGAKDAIPLIEECKEKWRRSRSFGRAADAALETLKKDDPKKGEMKKE